MTVLASSVERLETELWHPGAVRESQGTAAEGWEQHVVLDRGGALMVLPASSLPASAAAMARWSNAMSAAAVASRTAAMLGLRTGLAMVALRDRVDVRVTAAPGEPPTLHEHLAAGLGVDRVVVACTFGPPRPNQKPVVQVMTPDGKTLAFAKVGWNPLTARLVAHEAGFLGGPEPNRTTMMRLPKLLDLSSWQDRQIATLAAVLGRPRLRRPEAPGVPVLRSLLALGTPHDGLISESPYRAELARRTTSPELRSALQTIDERWGNERLPFGRWHGDWTPWNMRSDKDGLVVWDWERTAPDAPAGFDALHYAFQSSLGGDAAPVDLLLAAIATQTPTLEALGVAPSAIPAVAALYVVELAVRFEGKDQRPSDGVAWMEGLVPESLRALVVV